MYIDFNYLPQAPDKKYFKRGDLAAKQEEEYWRRHKRLKSDHGVRIDGDIKTKFLTVRSKCIATKVGWDGVLSVTKDREIIKRENEKLFKKWATELNEGKPNSFWLLLKRSNKILENDLILFLLCAMSLRYFTVFTGRYERRLAK